MKPLSELVPGLLVIQIQIQAVCFDMKHLFQWLYFLLMLSKVWIL